MIQIITVPSPKQSDNFSCGWFMLRTIEEVVPSAGSFPNGLYRFLNFGSEMDVETFGFSVLGRVKIQINRTIVEKWQVEKDNQRKFRSMLAIRCILIDARVLRA